MKRFSDSHNFKIYINQLEKSYIKRSADIGNKKILTGKVSSGAQILSEGGPFPDKDTRISNFYNIVKHMRKLNSSLL